MLTWYLMYHRGYWCATRHKYDQSISPFFLLIFGVFLWFGPTVRQRLEARGCANRSRVSTGMQFTTAKSIVLRSFSLDSLLILSSLARLLTLEGLYIELGYDSISFKILLILSSLAYFDNDKNANHKTMNVIFTFIYSGVLLQSKNPSESEGLYISSWIETKENSTWAWVKSYGKVHIFWEGHKILRNLHLTFVLCSASQK